MQDSSNALISIQVCGYLSINSTVKTVSAHITLSGSSTDVSNYGIADDCDIAFRLVEGGEVVLCGDFKHWRQRRRRDSTPIPGSCLHYKCVPTMK